MSKCPHCGQPINRSGVSVDLGSGYVHFRDWSMRGLPRRESLLLEALANAFPRGLTKDQVVDAVYGDYVDHLAYPGETILAHISKLRDRLVEARSPISIQSKRGSGYWLNVPHQESAT